MAIRPSFRGAQSIQRQVFHFTKQSFLDTIHGNRGWSVSQTAPAVHYWTKSADFRGGVSINIYRDVGKVKRNPIIEVFRYRPIEQLIVDIAICSDRRVHFDSAAFFCTEKSYLLANSKDNVNSQFRDIYNRTDQHNRMKVKTLFVNRNFYLFIWKLVSLQFWNKTQRNRKRLVNSRKDALTGGFSRFAKIRTNRSVYSPGLLWGMRLINEQRLSARSYTYFASKYSRHSGGLHAFLIPL